MNFLCADGKLLLWESADPGDMLGVVELKGLVDQDVGISTEAELDTVDVTVWFEGVAITRKQCIITESHLNIRTP